MLYIVQLVPGNPGHQPVKELGIMRLRPDWRIAEIDTDGLVLKNETRAVKVSTDAERASLLQSYLAEDSSGHREPDSRILPILDALLESQIVRYSDTATGERFSRLDEYFSCFTSQPELALDRLAKSHVMILGLGGTGSIILQHLVAAGVGSFVLVDSDSVAESNLNRQFVYEIQDVGRPKVDVCEEYAQRRLSDVNTQKVHTHLNSVEDVETLIRKFSPGIVIVAIDTPIETIVRTTTEALARHQIPYIVAGVGVRCGSSGEINVGRPDLRKFVGTSASISTTNTITASYAAHRVIEWITSVQLGFRMLDDE